MKQKHVPTVNARYWAGITLASIFGTNSGDLYAHELGLGITGGLLLLAAITGICFVIQARDPDPHEAWYWLVIILIRTGATNIADYLAFAVRVNAVLLVLGLCLVLASLAWRTHLLRGNETTAKAMPSSDVAYWCAMLTAGVLGTALGDDISHLVGGGKASLSLAVVLLTVLVATRSSRSVMAYWGIIAVARTAGTAMGDFLVGNRLFEIGLPVATALSGTAFVVLLYFWRQHPTDALPGPESELSARASR